MVKPIPAAWAATATTVLEDQPLLRLAKDGQIAAFTHHGFWQPMDTFRESQALNNLWNSGNPPWKVWH